MKLKPAHLYASNGLIRKQWAVLFLLALVAKIANYQAEIGKKSL